MANENEAPELLPCPSCRGDAKDKRIEELEAQNRELHMQVIASDSQAQMAYEEQEQLEAKLARVIEIANLIRGRMMR